MQQQNELKSVKFEIGCRVGLFFSLFAGFACAAQIMKLEYRTDSQKKVKRSSYYFGLCKNAASMKSALAMSVAVGAAVFVIKFECGRCNFSDSGAAMHFVVVVVVDSIAFTIHIRIRANEFQHLQF